MVNRNQHLIWLVLFLLLATFLRVHGLSQMANNLHHDEAYYGIDAVSLLQHPRLVAYFPNNTGRESLWMYLLAPSVAIFGATPFALRLVAIYVGILSVAAVYPLAYEFSGKKRAFWAVGILAVLYWHVHLSHIAFRANTFPLIGALAMAALLKAHRTQRGWINAGFWIGLLLYTYTAARVWVAYGGLCLALWWISAIIKKTSLTQAVMPVSNPQPSSTIKTPIQKLQHIANHGAFKALIVALLTTLPLVFAILQAGTIATSIESKLVPDRAYFMANLQHWVDAWLIQGDTISTHNYNGRPILDFPLALLTLVGIISFWRLIRPKWLLLWWLGLVFVSLMPTIIAIQTPHFLRGLGLVIPFVLLAGIGASFLLDSLRRIPFMPPRLSMIILLALFCWAGINSYQDFGSWLAQANQPAIYRDIHINKSMATAREQTPPTMPIILPGLQDYPVARFHSYGMPQREYFAYEWLGNACYVTTREPYVTLDIFRNGFETRAQYYSDTISTVVRDAQYYYNVYIVQPHDDLIADWVNSVLIGSHVEVQLVEPIPEAVTRGDTIKLELGMRLHQRFTEEYRFFVHLIGEPTPYEGGILWSSGDAPLCPQVYQTQWNIQQTLVQTLMLTIPEDIPAGTYSIAIGLYSPNASIRLPITPASNNDDYYPLFQFTID